MKSLKLTLIPALSWILLAGVVQADPLATCNSAEFRPMLTIEQPDASGHITISVDQEAEESPGPEFFRVTAVTYQGRILSRRDWPKAITKAVETPANSDDLVIRAKAKKGGNRIILNLANRMVDLTRGSPKHLLIHTSGLAYEENCKR